MENKTIYIICAVVLAIGWTLPSGTDGAACQWYAETSKEQPAECK